MKTISLGSTLKFLTTISWIGMIMVGLGATLRAEDAFTAKSYRIKGSGESITSKPLDGKAALPNEAPYIYKPAPPADIVFHQVENPPALPVSKKPEVAYVNHEVFGLILQKYVTKSGWVDYRSLKKDKEALDNLDAYVNDLAALNPSTLPDPQDKLASWLNLYNAMVLREILKYYPIESLLKIPNFYGSPRFKVGDKMYSLMDIEELVFHQELQEPRTILARVMGSTSGARMLQVPFDARKIDKQLEERTLAFLSDPANTQFDAKRKMLILNPTLLWYEQEFVDVRAFISNYLSGLPPNYQYSFFGYDWKLNDSKLH